MRCGGRPHATAPAASSRGRPGQPSSPPSPRYGGEGTSLLRQPGRVRAPKPARAPAPSLDLFSAAEEEEEGDDSAFSDYVPRAGRGRGARKAPLHASFAAHSARLRELSCLEFDDELQQTELRLRTWPPSRLLAEGLALFGLRAAQEPDLQTLPVFRFYAPALPEHRLGVGDMVSATPGRATPDDDSLSGVVLERGPAWVKVCFSSESAPSTLGGRGEWRLDLSANAVSHERALSALARFAQAGGMPQSPAPCTPSSTPPLPSSSFSQLQLALLGGPDAVAAAATPPPWLPSGKPGRRACTSAAAAHCALLNESQRRAVGWALGRTMSLWQGPPGTGKTATLLAFIRAALQLSRDASPGSRGACVLACAPSNLAADALAEGLLGPNPVRVVRLGAPSRPSSTPGVACLHPPPSTPGVACLHPPPSTPGVACLHPSAAAEHTGGHPGSPQTADQKRPQGRRSTGLRGKRQGQVRRGSGFKAAGAVGLRPQGQ